MALFRIAVAATLGFLIAAPATAQTGTGGLASVTVSSMTIEQDTTASIAASIGYRLNPIVALGIELTFVPSVEPHVPDFPAILSTELSGVWSSSGAIFPAPSISVEAEGGRATIFTGNLRLTIPTRSPRISPYLVGGAGVGNVRDELRYIISYENYRPLIPALGRPVTMVIFPPITPSIRRTTTDFAMTLGGGVSLLVSDHWAIDADVRYLGVAGERDIHTGRYGAGTTFRF